ncbi:hypothetical protein [Desulfospira joergensenii]|uniref:hypothetical protein n=1 Tax=Desulfospira joergensenii TaxID=53329 RepID=UPI0003B307A1|nr:hypothetical protein [Desulfospira joergensenii]
MIQAEMTVLDIVAKWKPTQKVFKRYDARAGECICCNMLFNTLDQVAEKYSLDLKKLMDDLEKAAREAGTTRKSNTRTKFKYDSMS